MRDHGDHIVGRSGFTVIELLVVLGIILLLASLITPLASKGIEKGRRVHCLGNLRSIAQAEFLRFQDEKGLLPYRGPDCLDYGQEAANLLPYVGNDPRVFDCPSNPGTKDAGTTKIPGLSPPAYTDYEFNGYLCTCGSGDELKRRKSGILDASECAFAYDYPYYPGAPGRAHQGGINVAYLDGHAAWLADEDMGLDSGDEKDKFFGKGHVFTYRYY